MEEIIIKDALFKRLKYEFETSREEEKYHKQFVVGFDYIEAMIKLFSTMIITAVKHKDEQLYTKLMQDGFGTPPSLGHFVNLVKNPFTTENYKKLNNDPLCKYFYELVVKEKQGFYKDISDIIKGVEEPEEIEIKSTKDFLNNCVTNFRNKTKGHGASFNEKDIKYRNRVLGLMDIIIENLEKDLEQIDIDNLKFYYDQDKNVAVHSIFMRFESKDYELIPILAYIGCEHTACQDAKPKRQKLFFYNGGRKTHEFLDYAFSHFSDLSDRTNKKFNQDVTSLMSKVTKDKKSELLIDFIGRNDKLDEVIQCLQDNTISLTCVYGKPGIGKSAFLTQLEKKVNDINLNIKPILFYAIKGQMEVEEDEFFLSQINSELDTLGVNVKLNKEDTAAQRLENLFTEYEKQSNENLLLMIDGLDEFNNPADIINMIPFNYKSKIHLILSYRDIPKIEEPLDVKIKTTQFKDKRLLIELTKLKPKEVEALLEQSIPREVAIGSTDYNSIVSTIAKRSEGIPLYIHFIVKKLKEIKKSQNIVKDIIAWSEKLPKNLEKFYEDTFKSIEPLSREILYMVYLSKSGIDFTTIYDILAEDNDEVDEFKFQEKYFNDIEVFLKYDEDGNYIFYHLSVKEAILEYLKSIGSILTFNKEKLKSIMFETILEYYADQIDEIEYVKEKSTIHKVLNKTIKYLDQNKKNTYAQTNLIHLKNTLVWIHIYHNIISYENMTKDKYSSILDAKLIKENKKEIRDLYKEVDSKETLRHKYEIRYVYELAFLEKNYQKVLGYKDMYEQYTQNLFLDIALNIDKVEYIQKFITHKDDWLNSVTSEAKDIFVNIIAQQEVIDDKFYDVLLFLDDEHRIRLLTSITEEKALHIAEMMSSEEYPQAFRYVVSMTHDKQLLSKVLDILEKCSDDLTIQMTTEAIVSQTDDEKLINRSLKISKKTYNNVAESRVMLLIASKKNTIKEALKVAESIPDNEYKAKALMKILSTIDDIDECLDLINYFPEGYKSKALAHIALKTNNTQMAMDISKKIQNIYIQTNTVITIASKTNNVDLFDAIFKFIGSIPYSIEKSGYLSHIISSTNNNERLGKVLEEVETIPDDFDKSNLLISIAIKINNKESLNEILAIAEKISDKECRLETIESVVFQIENIESHLKITNEILDPKYELIDNNTANKTLMEANKTFIDRMKTKYLTLVATKTDDLHEALNIVQEIPDLYNQSKIMISILLKTNDEETINRILNISNKIFSDSEDEFFFAELLILIASKLNNQKLLNKSLLIIENIDDDVIKSMVLLSIISNISNKKILDNILNIARKISYKSDKSKVLVSIAFKTNDEELLAEALNILNQCIQDNNDAEEEDIVEILTFIADKTNDMELLNKILTMIEKMSNPYCKSRIIGSVVPNIDDVQRAKKLIKEEISDEYYKALALTSILSSIDNEPLLKEALSISKTLVNEYQKSNILINIISNTNDIKLLLKVLNVTNSIVEEKYRFKVLYTILFKVDNNQVLKVTNHLSNFYKLKILKKLKIDRFNNLFFDQLFNSKTNILETLDIVTEFSTDDVLRYYNIHIKDTQDKSQFQVLITELIDLHKINIDTRENIKEFNSIKNKVSENEELLGELITLYGENLGVSNYSDFDEKFRFSNLDAIIKEIFHANNNL
ncbi:hypothetical protein [Candidatus Sulfurimonas baltica]|uniref:Uncharacterized protein n=1 Tax=Candidatus Sulfurimonas baltica TaxID=2740404 RepID=A0A7S7RLW7_9BACT|nr:hypothetical protein [Candidatus Sulfurimonas baltica]QOY50954.1 hypothetical protein HUE88_07295 [Candidatus Sulfurimonas baltica]